MSFNIDLYHVQTQPAPSTIQVVRVVAKFNQLCNSATRKRCRGTNVIEIGRRQEILTISYATYILQTGFALSWRYFSIIVELALYDIAATLP